MSSTSSNSKLKFSKGQCQFEEHYWGENLTLAKTGELGGVLPDPESFVFSPSPQKLGERYDPGSCERAASWLLEQGDVGTSQRNRICRAGCCLVCVRASWKPALAERIFIGAKWDCPCKQPFPRACIWTSQCQLCIVAAAWVCVLV